MISGQSDLAEQNRAAGVVDLGAAAILGDTAGEPEAGNGHGEIRAADAQELMLLPAIDREPRSSGSSDGEAVGDLREIGN